LYYYATLIIFPFASRKQRAVLLTFIISQDLKMSYHPAFPVNDPLGPYGLDPFSFLLGPDTINNFDLTAILEGGKLAVVQHLQRKADGLLVVKNRSWTEEEKKVSIASWLQGRARWWDSLSSAEKDAHNAKLSRWWDSLSIVEQEAHNAKISEGRKLWWDSLSSAEKEAHHASYSILSICNISLSFEW